MKSGLKLIVKTRLPQRNKLFPLELVLMYILVLNSSITNKEWLTEKKNCEEVEGRLYFRSEWFIVLKTYLASVSEVISVRRKIKGTTGY